MRCGIPLGAVTKLTPAQTRLLCAELQAEELEARAFGVSVDAMLTPKSRKDLVRYLQKGAAGIRRRGFGDTRPQGIKLSELLKVLPLRQGQAMPAAKPRVVKTVEDFIKDRTRRKMEKAHAQQAPAKVPPRGKRPTRHAILPKDAKVTP